MTEKRFPSRDGSSKQGVPSHPSRTNSACRLGPGTAPSQSTWTKTSSSSSRKSDISFRPCRRPLGTRKTSLCVRLRAEREFERRAYRMECGQWQPGVIVLLSIEHHLLDVRAAPDRSDGQLAAVT